MQFEDLEAWKKARALSAAVYAATDREPFSRDFALKDQIRRSAISMLSNIAEGYERGGDKEFRQFLAQAKGSAGEVRAQIYLALDAKLLDSETFDNLQKLCLETSKLIAGLIRYLNEGRFKGSKFKSNART